MRYERKEQFEKVNAFGTGTANTTYAQYFTGDSFLNPLTDPEGGLFAANVTFEPGCRNNWHIHHADKGGAVSSCSARLARAGTRRKARPPSACTRAAS